MNSIFSVVFLLSSFSYAFAAPKRETVECSNQKESIYVWFCRQDGKLSDLLCDAPHVQFVAKENEEGVRPKVRVEIKAAALGFTRDTRTLNLDVSFSKSKEEPNKLLKILSIKSASLVGSAKVPKREYVGTGTLTLPREVADYLKENKVDFDKSETYTCYYEAR